MLDSGSQEMAARRLQTVTIAGLGTAVTVGYACLAVLQILVLNPLAAVPGAGLDQIWAGLATAGESLGAPRVLVIMGVGPLVALALLLFAATSAETAPPTVATAYLTLVVFGSPAYFVASFGAGMALADTFGINGGDYSPWARPLHATSGIAILGLVALGVWHLLRRGVRAGQPGEPPSFPTVLR